MRFMIIRKADELTEAGVQPSAEILEAMMRYNQELADAGVLVAGEGLHPSVDAAHVSFKGGSSTVIDGPFAEAKELIAGFTIIDCSSRDEALEWVRRWPEPDVELEVRQAFTVDEFEHASDEVKAIEARLRG